MREAIAAFLLGFPALFSIVNPISGALIFRRSRRAASQDAAFPLAGQVALNSLVVMMVRLWAGSYVLAFFGISLAALRVAGGLVVAMSGWHLLNAPETQRTASRNRPPSGRLDDIALFPLTIPITTGPGTISVAVALGAGHPRQFPNLGWFFLGMTAAAVAMAAMIWVTYRYADRLTAADGADGRRTHDPAGGVPAAVHRRADPDNRGRGRDGPVWRGDQPPERAWPHDGPWRTIALLATLSARFALLPRRRGSSGGRTHLGTLTMKLKADRATLIKALAHVQSVVERRNTIPILANVMIAVRDGELR